MCVANLRQYAAGLFSMCALTALLELVVGDDSTWLGFRSVCGAAIALSIARLLSKLLSL